MKLTIERFSLFAVKVQHYLSTSALFALMIFLVQIASPETGGGTGR